ncbi:MAG TPA: transketolase C-terminal domain-containing protein [Herpetosiphonaceae bacterium]
MTHRTERCVHVLNRALHRLFEEHPEVYLLGEDILDPYGGAFKVSTGLSTRWPERVLTTPISEAAIVGIANGMALRGLRPIVEIMFGDFLTLCADQIINYAAKFRQMYDDQVRCPVVIRTPMGGRRGYGPTHSQTMERLFLSVDDLTILAPSHLHDLGEALIYATLQGTGPTLFVENKLLYGEFHALPQHGLADLFSCRRLGSAPLDTLYLSLTDFEYSDVTILCYGGMTSLAMQAAEQLLLEHEISCELLIPCQIKPLPDHGLAEALARSGRLLVVEEGPLTGGWGAEVAAQVQERYWTQLRGPVQRVAAADGIIPCTRPLEDAALPQKIDLVRAATRMVHGAKVVGI